LHVPVFRAWEIAGKELQGSNRSGTIQNYTSTHPAEAAVQTITGTYHNGQIVPDGRVAWPESTRVHITPRSAPGKRGLDESEWRDDPAALADWDAWLPTIEPLEFTPEEEAERARFGAAMRQFNVEAVRRRREQGPDP
jgi:hypothetical protein